MTQKRQASKQIRAVATEASAARDAGSTPADAAYVRVSSKTQDYPTQRHAIERHAAAHGRRLDAWYIETRTATKRNAPRPELDRLDADAKAGRVRSVTVFRLDRLTRLGVRDTLATVEALKEAGCAIHFVADGLASVVPGERDTMAAAMSEGMLSMMAVCARIEGIARSERVAAARERVESEDGDWGRPARMTSPDVDKARELRAAGLTLRDVAQRMQVPRSTLARALAVDVDKARTMLAQGRTLAEAARELGAPVSMLRRALNRKEGP